MKKLALVVCTLLFTTISFAKDYKITNVEYTLNPSSWKFLGTTKQFALENNVEVNKSKKFETLEDLEAYINDYKQRLDNTRAFDDYSVEYKINETSDLNEVTLYVTTTDTVHLLAVPYPKYDSNSGAVLKLKAKDSNFLGTMNTMSTDLNLSLDTTGDETKFALGFNFDYDYPFKAGIFNATWVNSYSIDYTFGEDLPDWSGKTGLKFELPKTGISYILELYQKVSYSGSYKSYGDQLYFTEYATFSMPITLGEINYFGKVTTTPSISATYNWDMDGIDSNNTGLSSPFITVGNTIGTSRINWHNNFRTGLSANLATKVDYNLQRKTVNPYITSEVRAFKGFTLFDNFNYFNRLGICSDIYGFYYFNDKKSSYASSDGQSIGSRLRGIKDSQGYSNIPASGNSTTVPAAFVVNLDFPVHIFSTNFSKGFMKHFNFDLQVSPFVDFALTYNKATEKLFDYKDGFYAAGVEVLVYPRKWSSFVVRGSIGVDIGRWLLSDFLNTEWREEVNKKEISIGIGLHY